jgi:8-oxo-dGTP diphosphatase
MMGTKRKPEIRIALVILENQAKKFGLQLRSNIPTIVNPDLWGFFGGHVEEGEIPEEGALREVEEELSCSLDPVKLTFLSSFHQASNKIFYVYHYPISDELDEAVLTEGEDFGFFTRAEIELGLINGKKIVSYLREVILNYLDK